MSTYSESKDQPTIRIAPPEPRSLLLPILAAVVSLGIAAAISLHFFPSTSVDMHHIRTEAVEETTRFKSQSIVIGADATETDLYIVETVEVVNAKRMPLFINDITLTLTDKAGAQMKVSALTKSDMEATEQSFPNLRPLLTTPLLRESTIDRDKTVTGTLLFHLPFSKEVWDSRQSAVVEMDFYHQRQSEYMTIPK